MNENRLNTLDRQLDFSELLPGDILVFSAEKDDVLSLAISYLTDSDVSHTGLYLGLNDKREALFAEEVALGIKSFIMSPNLNGRKAYVQRLKEVSDLNPVLHTAKLLLRESKPCDWTFLILLSLILLYKKIPNYKYPESLVTKILLVAASAMDEYLHRNQDSKKRLMICSQFVSSCFEEASKRNPKYKLDFLEEQFLNTSSWEPNLIMKVLSEIHNTSGMVEFNAVEFEDTYSDIESEIVLWLKKQKKKTILLEQNTLFDFNNDFIAAVILFSDKWYELRFGESSLSSIDKLNRNAVDYNHSLFVTPADLKINVKTLDSLGWLSFDRFDDLTLC